VTQHQNKKDHQVNLDSIHHQEDPFKQQEHYSHQKHKHSEKEPNSQQFQEETFAK
jgi:hypothetical protein